MREITDLPYPCYDIIEMNNAKLSEKARFWQSSNKKEPLNLNGGLNAHRFKLLVQRSVNNLDTKDTDKISYFMNDLFTK